MTNCAKYILPFVISTAIINIIFLYRYASIEYNIESDTDIVIRKLNSIEEKIDTLINKE